METADGVSALFSPDGTLRYTIRDGDALQIMLLTYQVRGGVLITDQPSKPRREITTFWFDAAGRLVLQSAKSTAWFIRDEPSSAA